MIMPSTMTLLESKNMYFWSSCFFPLSCWPESADIFLSVCTETVQSKTDRCRYLSLYVERMFPVSTGGGMLGLSSLKPGSDGQWTVAHVSCHSGIFTFTYLCCSYYMLCCFLALLRWSAGQTSLQSHFHSHSGITALTCSFISLVQLKQ